MTDIPRQYDPRAIEEAVYSAWLDEKVFHAVIEKGGTPFTIVIPPPNITGILHMGHALNNTIQDVLVRQKRMEGRNTLWVPGTDHAGIATQNVVEKELARESTTRQEVGRERFVERVWAWREKHGGIIIEQLKRLGCSCDWDRERFTMDESLSRAVREVFVRLYEKDLIYRDQALVNWCPRCHTTLSNEECPVTEEQGKFWNLRYPVTGGEGFIEVATTRPETMLGDTAVAVHPDDPRYRGLVGKTVRLPLAEREIPVIADDHADPAKGSGAVKITPAHDFDDFRVGKRHDLDVVRVIDDSGRMTAAAGAYEGLDRFEGRRRVLADLEARGLLGAAEDRAVPLPRCYRCETVIEPTLSTQWFVRMRPLMEPAARAVREGRVRFVPKRYETLFFEWVEKYIDWPISRQIWWGHRIPAWYCADCGATIVAREDPASCSACGSSALEQDPDVLDTWFSSALWPFSTLGWPDKTADLGFYYPTDVLVTARDIIYFWVARMIMSGLQFMGERPFHTVYVHGTILDEIGRRMSKSLGNGIDPIEMIETYGADAVRFSLMMLCTEGQDIKLSPARFEMGRNFANKIWNAARFLQLQGRPEAADPSRLTADPGELRADERYLLARADDAVVRITDAFDRLRFDEIARESYEFLWHAYCDWGLEAAKAAMADASVARKEAVLGTLYHVLGVALRLLHPVMPFLTEQLWESLGFAVDHRRIAAAPWPQPFDDSTRRRYGLSADVVARAEAKYELVRAVRSIRGSYSIPPGRRLRLTIRPVDGHAEALVREEAESIRGLAGADEVAIDRAYEGGSGVASAVAQLGAVYVPLGDLIDVGNELRKFESQIAGIDKDIAVSERKLANPSFVDRAPAEVVQRERDKLAELGEKRARLEQLVGALR